MDVVASSKFDEFYTPEHAIYPILKYLKPNSVIWCPFDTEESNFVKIFKKSGFNVINTHLEKGEDFFSLNIKCDYIISNPPYSLKGKILKRLFNLNVPFAMLVGVVGLFESQDRFFMFRQNNFEIMYLNKRISFFKDFKEQKPSINPPFSSVYVTKNILPKPIVFEIIDTKIHTTLLTKSDVE